MEAIYLYCAFSYLFMLGYMMVEYPLRKEKASILCTWAASPITFPVLVGIISN